MSEGTRPSSLPHTNGLYRTIASPHSRRQGGDGLHGHWRYRWINVRFRIFGVLQLKDVFHSS